VPNPLWLSQFDANRKHKRLPSASSDRLPVYMPRGSAAINFATTAGRPSSAVAHLLHVSELAELPRRPETSTRRAGGS
jgi:hypothetical protein